MLERLKLFLQESRRELSRVNWPTREETMRLTGVVIAISVAIAAFLGAFDYLFLKGVQAIVGISPAPIEAPLTATTTDSLFNIAPESVGGEGDLDINVEKPKEGETPLEIPTN